MQSVPDAERRYVLTSAANEQMRVTITDVAERRAGESTAALVIAVRHGVPLGTPVPTILAVPPFR